MAIRAAFENTISAQEKDLQHKTLLLFAKEKVIVAKVKLCGKNGHNTTPFPLLWTLYHQWWNFASVNCWIQRIFSNSRILT